MAKTGNKTNSKTKWVSIGITLVVIFASVIASFVWGQAGIVALENADKSIKENYKAADTEITKDHDKEMNVFKEATKAIKDDGCKPAQKAGTDVLILQNNYERLQEDVGEIKTEQKAFIDRSNVFQKAVLEELRK